MLHYHFPRQIIYALTIKWNLLIILIFFQPEDDTANANNIQLSQLADVLWHGRYKYDAEFVQRNRKLKSRGQKTPNYDVFYVRQKKKVSERH